MYYRARYYDPSLGQFISPDTIVPDPSSVLSYNRYLYTRGNPIVFSDPTGHKNIREAGGGGLIGSTAYGMVNESMSGQAGPETIEAIHQGLDAWGTVDFTGIADGANAVIYAAEGEFGYVLISSVSILPFGDFLKAGKYADEATDLTVGTYNQLRKSAGDGHHIIQDASVRDLPGYNSGQAPAVSITGPSTQVGSPHYNATRVQEQLQYGGGTYAAERRIGYRALRSAGLSPERSRQLIEYADSFFEAIGVDLDTPTRIPGNRR